MAKLNDFDFVEKLNARALKDLICADARERNIIKGQLLEKMVARAVSRRGYKMDKINTSRPTRIDVIGKDKETGEVKVVIECTNFGKDSRGRPYYLKGKRLNDYVGHFKRYSKAAKFAVTSYRDCLGNGLKELSALNVTVIELGYDVEPRQRCSPDSRFLELRTYRDIKKKIFNSIPKYKKGSTRCPTRR